MFVAEQDLPGGRLGFAANHIQERRLAGAVRPDHDPQLVILDAEVAVVQRLEAVVVHDDVFAGENRGSVRHAAVLPSALINGAGVFFRSVNFRIIPTSPSGNIVTTTTKRPPRINGQASGK